MKEEKTDIQQQVDLVYESLTIQALRMRNEIFFGAGMDKDTFDKAYLNDLGEYERNLAEKEGIKL